MVTGYRALRELSVICLSVIRLQLGARSWELGEQSETEKLLPAP